MPHKNLVRYFEPVSGKLLYGIIELVDAWFRLHLVFFFFTFYRPARFSLVVVMEQILIHSIYFLLYYCYLDSAAYFHKEHNSPVCNNRFNLAAVTKALIPLK